MTLFERLRAQSVRALLRIGCGLAIAGLTLMLASVLFPRPLIVIAAMSVGHGLGFGAFACYLLAVILDVARAPARPSSQPPPANQQETS